MKYRFIKANSNGVTAEVEDEIVDFEIGDKAEKHEYSTSHFMNGYIQVGEEWVLKYQSIAEFENGSDNFVDMEEVELHEDYKELV